MAVPCEAHHQGESCWARCCYVALHSGKSHQGGHHAEAFKDSYLQALKLGAEYCCASKNHTLSSGHLDECRMTHA